MIINQKKLLKNTTFDEDRRARKVALHILSVALNSVEPRRLIKNHVHKVSDVLTINNLIFDLAKFRRVFVVGGGKASGAMAEALEEVMGKTITKGFVNILRGTKSKFKTHKIVLNEVSHPLPGNKSIKETRKIFRLASEANKNDLVICLISGGGSALMSLPVAHITLRDKQELTGFLLKCGATINEINTVRKHISALKGGQLARVAYPATLISIILSDVVGDPLDSIASGPTMPDTTTFSDAISVLKKYNLWQDITPEAIKRRLRVGVKGKIPETPKPDNKVFEKTYDIVLGNNHSATISMCQEARRLGFNTLLLSSMIEGEARHVGTVLAGISKEILASGDPLPKPAVVVAGGETTVTVTGYGKGGRNQELVLGGALKIEGLKGVSIASVDTDGIDGPTDAAGAIVDGQTIIRAQHKNLDPNEFLVNNNSYEFFSKIDDLIFTDSTGTNVNSLTVIVAI